MTKLSELIVVSNGGIRGKWWCYAEVVVVAEVYVGTRTKFGELWTENGAVDGSDAARGRMSELDGRMSGGSGRMFGLWIRGRTPRGKWQIGAKFGGFCGWKLGKRWEKARSTCNT